MEKFTTTMSPSGQPTNHDVEHSSTASHFGVGHMTLCSTLIASHHSGVFRCALEKLLKT